MHCTLTRADGARIHTNLALTPTRYSANALGGPDAATVSVSGDKNALWGGGFDKLSRGLYDDGSCINSTAGRQ